MLLRNVQKLNWQASRGIDLHRGLRFASTLLLTSVFLLCLLAFSTPKAGATPAISSVDPNRGRVGTTVHVWGRIDVRDGEYSILFAGQPVKNGTASGTRVDDYFVVPSLPNGTYSVVLYDVAAKSESAPLNFTIIPYFRVGATAKPHPMQIQEGENVNIWANVSGGKANWAYLVNVTVIDPAKSVYWVGPTIHTDENGLGNVSLTYPSDFIPPGANTNYTGTYQITLNGTVATGSFFVGITDAYEYHRFETVRVKALGYNPERNVTITIEFPDGRTPFSNETSVQRDGIVQFFWEVPGDSPVGEYTLSISQVGWKKKVEDVQTFLVPGFPVKIKALNLNGEPVPSVNIKVHELRNESSQEVAKGMTGNDGVAEFQLEIGNYNCKAYLREKSVGETLIHVLGEGSWNLTCNLINIKITVEDWNTLEPLPFVVLSVTSSYVVENETKTYTAVEETDINGTAVFHSMFTNVSYVIEASRYGGVFNTTRIERLFARKLFNLTIMCPPRNLEVHVLDSNLAPLPGATVTAYELTFAYPVGEGETDDSGRTVLNLTFGRYKVKVFMSGVLLNETEVNLAVQAKSLPITIYCEIYNVDVLVKVSDFFGNPIPNAKVEVAKEEASYKWESLTDTNGVASFQRIVGGDCQISVYIGGSTTPCLTRSVYIDQAKIITFKVVGYVVFLGFLMETMVFSTLITLAITVSAALAFFAYTLLKKRVKR